MASTNRGTTSSARSMRATALTNTMATTRATSKIVKLANSIALSMRPMRRFCSCSSWRASRLIATEPSLVCSCSWRPRSMMRARRLLSTPSRPLMPASRNTGATDS